MPEPTQAASDASGAVSESASVARDWPCPACRVDAGAPCQTDQGHDAPWFHQARQDAVRGWANALSGPCSSCRLVDGHTPTCPTAVMNRV